MMKSPSTIDELRAELLAAANELFENDELEVNAWLNRPLRAIGYKTPIEYMDSPEKIGTLRDVIGRLEHGVWT
ncbi:MULTISPECIES: MbcA/ParS/Xre antitoxin family protein [unclassified Marinobacter]|jgi:putative toxin-antitoxin system antitoxin component (TIGR02293 family)|uniref:MbcA/ParS/Xre antitoxin family protein n=1 Tax=unclassified Marinobacter TaxID=83889 RepID=UPI00200D32F3|nr:MULTISPECIES: MbcA/ParS/Xre antitoxin family protein [unclassified Marinobacter]MCL1483744.1 MbcA/ParS/Xre antitoxin family protein [Marinobacter sp.]UQG55329.1 MbcA/ParS/Xre antitoxin family protein [Marinobacter sp. M4C]UQG64132.1 MbcA/ParS/Xre antitoxin family protein [Marinobacter sp. M2C]UQG68416.1 MbcA/ParS/Xre antitoxin family protein [Marinobacter sp. M1C]